MVWWGQLIKVETGTTRTKILFLSPHYIQSHCTQAKGENIWKRILVLHAVLTKKKKTCHIFYYQLHYYKIILCMMSNKQCCNAVTAC